MTILPIRVAPRFKTLITPRARQLVAGILDSGLISYGALSLEFEKRLAAIHECQYGILSSSGTSSLQVGLQALKETRHWRDGDRVIVPATTFCASPNVVMHNRMTPDFVDVDSRTYNLAPELIEVAITPATRAIMAVHLFGQPANMTAINDIARHYGLAVIEDSCETLYAHHAGRMVGSLSDVAAMSFYAAHILVTGVGGMSLTNDPELAGKVRSLVNHGLTLECLDAGENFSPRPVANRLFRFDSIGHSSRLTEIEAALGLGQLDDWQAMIAARRSNAAYLTGRMVQLNARYDNLFQLPYIAPDNEHSFMMYPLVLRRGDRDSLIAHLAERKIESRDALPLLIQPAYSYVNRADFPVSDNLIRNAFYIGAHQELTESELDYIAEVFGDWAKTL